MREFMSPSGRRWFAGLFYVPENAAATLPGSPGIAVLRFRSDDDVTLDLDAWPDDWFRMDEGGLVSLLRRATTPSLGSPMRRRERTRTLLPA